MKSLATASLCLAFALLTFFQFPGHTWLQQDTQIYAPILEHLRDPGVLRNEIVVEQAHLAYSLYDEVALGLRRLTRFGFREILTANQYAELELRGFLSREERLAETAKHGMSQRDSDLLYDVLGRAIAVHALVTGEARGGTFDGPIGNIPAAFLSAMRRSNIRPEFYNLAYANRYNYPSAFVTRALLQGGAISEAEGEQIFLDVGWKPELARKVAAHYATATTGA